MEAAVISEKGLRPAMEDAHFLDLNFADRGWVYGGVYDGHGGSYAAEYAAENLHRLFLDRLLFGAKPLEAFTESYETVSEELKNQSSGTTAVDFLIRDEEIFTANAGDARAIVVSKQDVFNLTVAHRLDNKEERERVRQMGGNIVYPYTYRGNQGIMPTRTLGDPYFRAVGIIPTPSVSEHRITRDDLMLIAACDGLFDFITDSEAAGLARLYTQPSQLVEELKKEVLNNRFGTDNITVMAVSLKNKR